MPPQTRKPTGKVPWPFILLAGEEKAGKSAIAALLSRSQKVGTVYWLDLGEGAADEYAIIPGVTYEVLTHDGTFSDILARILEVYAEAERAADAGEPPVVLVIDSLGALWRMLSIWTTNRAARSKSNRAALAQDPDAEIDVTVNYWNDANDRHRRIIDLLKGMRGIVIATARLKEVTVMDRNGRPTSTKEWKADTQKDVPYDSTATIHAYREPRRAELVAARSLRIVGVSKGEPVDLPVPDLFEDLESPGYLETLVFDMLGCSVEESSGPRDYQRLDASLVERFLADIKQADDDGLKFLWAASEQQFPPGPDRTQVRAAIHARHAILSGDPAEQEPGSAPPAPGTEDPEQARLRNAIQEAAARQAAQKPAEPPAEPAPSTTTTRPPRSGQRSRGGAQPPETMASDDEPR